MASHWFNWRKGVVHYKKSGMGDPLLLVHDLHSGASGEDFDRNVRTLSGHFTVYRIDLVGFGMSDGQRLRYHAKDYTALLRDFVRGVVGTPTDVTAIGASVAFAATASVENPELFGKLVMISPDVSVGSSGPWSLGTRMIREAFWLALVATPFRRIFREVMTGEWEIGEFLRRTIFDRRTLDSSKLVELQVLAREPHALYAYASLEAGFLRLPLRTALPKMLGAPLFICGREVDNDYAATVKDMAALVAGSRVAWVDKARMWPHYETARRTNELIVNFLSRHDAIGSTSSKDERPFASAAYV